MTKNSKTSTTLLAIGDSNGSLSIWVPKMRPIILEEFLDSLIIDMTWDISEKILIVGGLGGEVGLVDLHGLDMRLSTKEEFLKLLETKYLEEAQNIMAFHDFSFQRPEEVLMREANEPLTAPINTIQVKSRKGKSLVISKIADHKEIIDLPQSSQEEAITEPRKRNGNPSGVIFNLENNIEHEFMTNKNQDLGDLHKIVHIFNLQKIQKIVDPQKPFPPLPAIITQCGEHYQQKIIVSVSDDRSLVKWGCAHNEEFTIDLSKDKHRGNTKEPIVLLVTASGNFVAFYTSNNILMIYNIVQCVEVIRQIIRMVCFLQFSQHGSELIIAKKITNNQVDQRKQVSVAILVDQCQSPIYTLKIINRKDPKLVAILQNQDTFIFNNSTENWEIDEPKAAGRRAQGNIDLSLFIHKQRNEGMPLPKGPRTRSREYVELPQEQPRTLIQLITNNLDMRKKEALIQRANVAVSTILNQGFEDEGIVNSFRLALAGLIRIGSLQNIEGLIDKLLQGYYVAVDANPEDDKERHRQQTQLLKNNREELKELMEENLLPMMQLRADLIDLIDRVKEELK